jgi:hypothetical protein
LMMMFVRLVEVFLYSAQIRYMKIAYFHGSEIVGEII